MKPGSHSNRDRSLVGAFVASDFCLSLVAIVVFQIVRYYLSSPYFGKESSVGEFLLYPVVGYEILGLPFVMLGAYWLSGFYASGTDGKSRLSVVGNTILIACVVSLLFFSTAVINDSLPKRRFAYLMAVALAACLTFFPLIGRMCIVSRTAKRFREGERRVKAAVLGTGQESRKLAERIDRDGKASWFEVDSFVDVDGIEGNDSREIKRRILSVSMLPEVVRQGQVETILVPPEFPTDTVLTLLNRLYDLPVEMYAAPALGNLVSPVPRISDVNNEPLVNILRTRIHPGVANLKRVSDIIVASLGLVISSPFLAVVAVAVKVSSPGPVFYRQERLGRYRRPFRILKFRTMKVDAEAAGPTLSSGDNDPRITRVGRFLRKYRIDEIPNLWNVVMGDMSLVGPRPERSYFVERILRRAPAYGLLFNVRPGLTSWGMVRFGYAQNIDEMIERMRYDLLYIENLSFGVDLKIMIHTIATIIKGKGK